MSVMDNKTGSTPSTVSTSSNSLFNENIMKQVLKQKDLIPGDINSNNEELLFEQPKNTKDSTTKNNCFMTV